MSLNTTLSTPGLDAPDLTVLTAHRLHNLRPVGGVPTRDGLWVRDDLLWRSAAPFSEREAGSRAIVGLGVRTVIDLRDQAERERTPRAWLHESLTVQPLPVFNDQLHTIRFDELPELYSVMVTEYAAQLAQAFALVSHRVGRPVSAPEKEDSASGGVLFHCTAGKDRTGLLSALILEVLGVARDVILDNFALSQQYLGDEYLAELFGTDDAATLPGLAAHRATASPPDLLAGALHLIDATYGNSVNYLLAHGVTHEDIAHLQTALVVARS